MNKTSSGEKKIQSLLSKGGFQYQKEVSFETLVGKKKTPLRYDFAVYKNKQFICLIEVDGEQHFKYVPYFHKNRSNFLKAKERDRVKNSFCLRNGIPLIRIPYWDLKDLTLLKIFTKQSYQVKSKYHIDQLIQGGECQ